MTTRRRMLALSAATLALSGTRALFAGTARATRPLDLLVLGGTGFLGPHQVEYALARGHRVTLFNRGHKDASLYGDRVEVLTGDRDARTPPGLTALAGTRRWDAVIDNSGYLPRHVADSAALLKGRVGRYLFVSTVAAYQGTDPVCTESSPLRPPAAAGEEQLTAQSYPLMKAEGDRIVRALYGAAATVVRPTYVIGPGDETDRFTYWAARSAQGGTVVGPRADAVDLQTVDARDLCPWLITLLEEDASGIFNAAAPPVPWDRVLEELRPLSATPVRFVRPPAAVIEELKVDFPLVSPSPTGHELFAHPRTVFDGSLAQRHGLSYRRHADSGSATLAWWRAQTPERRAAARYWPTAEQERAILARLALP
ncbi:MAG: NAD-dependent epimerase/dehydratase family protein [Proteobacteria bacterium]|nr:NAD-dependent epimerase/dehydratase family protein [Pseudomonadota bacterium]